MIDRLRTFLGSLAEPSGFNDDPYGWATNQISHAMFIGFGAATFFAFLTFKAGGEWLDQRITFAVVVGVYAVIWEAAIQGWRKLDSIMDTAFVALGAGAYLVIDMAYVIERVTLWYVALIAMLAPGIMQRLRK